MRIAGLFLTIFLLIHYHDVRGQKQSPAKYGHITVADFSTKAYKNDSAGAVVIADIGASSFEGNRKGSFTLVFRHYRRAIVLHKRGYNIAEVEVVVQSNDDNDEELRAIRGTTYNLVDGKIVETKLEIKEAVFKERISKNIVIKKFTLPNVREGSIIEFEYKLYSDFIFNLQPWEFQGDYPRIWSEYTLDLPQFYNYVTLKQGYHPYHIQEQKEVSTNFSLENPPDDAMLRGAGVNRQINFTAAVTRSRWVMKDVPALKYERFTSTLKNHIARLGFQLSEIRKPFDPKKIMSTWPEVSRTLLEDEEFAAMLGEENSWMQDIIGQADATNLEGVEKAKAIFSFLRDQLTSTGNRGLYARRSLRNIWKDKSGSVAEINLFLTAVLMQAGFDASPVILSTRQHGIAYATYPLMDRFNYVISSITIDGRRYLVDASVPQLGFGRLSPDCYNGHARVIDDTATALNLPPDSVVEQKLTSIFLVSDSVNRHNGSLQQTSGYFESLDFRKSIRQNGKQTFYNEHAKSIGERIILKAAYVDSLDIFEEPITLRMKFSLTLPDADILYVNPMFGEGWKENPFQSEQRLYPVEMPYAIDETFILRMDIPVGYEIDELPGQAVVKLNPDEDGIFEYRVQADEHSISFRSRLKIKRTYFMPDEYESLREFFGLVVKKHSSQIVFRKKKN